MTDAGTGAGRITKWVVHAVTRHKGSLADIPINTVAIGVSKIRIGHIRPLSKSGAFVFAAVRRVPIDIKPVGFALAQGAAPLAAGFGRVRQIAKVAAAAAVF
jgi:hypothetical protein